jgi:hypothetical protein
MHFAFNCLFYLGIQIHKNDFWRLSLMDASTASAITEATTNYDSWFTVFFYIGLTIIYALGFQSGQRYG